VIAVFYGAIAVAVLAWVAACRGRLILAPVRFRNGRIAAMAVTALATIYAAGQGMSAGAVSVGQTFLWLSLVEVVSPAAFLVGMVLRETRFSRLVMLASFATWTAATALPSWVFLPTAVLVGVASLGLATESGSATSSRKNVPPRR